ncbi:MAG: energy transducer TonB [Woeseiaceae bacterium]|nr:energy transducer TonB [Woeseiaceae bacterium]
MSLRRFLLVVVGIMCIPAPGMAQSVREPVVSEVERVPLHTVVPDYPKEARRDRIEGEVEVCFNVDRKGRPMRIGVRRSTHRVFEKAAIRAVRASRYTPLKRSEPVPSIKTCRTFTFSLERGASGA